MANFILAFLSVIFGAWLMFLHQDFQSFYLSIILAVLLVIDDKISRR